MTWRDLQRIYRGWVIKKFDGVSDKDGTQTIHITIILEKKP